MCPNLGGFDEGFYNNSSRVGLLIRLGHVQDYGLLIFSGPFNLASGGFLKAPPLISNCSNLPSGKVMEAGVLPTRNWDKKSSVPRSPTGSFSISIVADIGFRDFVS